MPVIKLAVEKCMKIKIVGEIQRKIYKQELRATLSPIAGIVYANSHLEI
ncbi:hypothetical protein GNE08_02740 [Trichormus variabilis ARAD]|uniref:Uncharacterized protein n=1 Tax=Trichormus variabilis N2B TaxID=2681315 RepID=A0ABR6S676_ANAVA|nr:MULTISPECIES: hypothetical protein [Nostocaceae]MBC1213141.1 hypothetical protein [Trichormus variabilis ARAD]MBC1253986.1 hypothetical protein [Trichormus variabilis V5]MBC1265571.1 hypothetical protein [Trichormus variabilis FSR]MBC1301758.1 hypothetical protein [Trichormus variabilis N2B]MBC1310182.1 hypothetical protein [Trichormus variabilis PNB]